MVFEDERVAVCLQARPVLPGLGLRLGRVGLLHMRRLRPGATRIEVSVKKVGKVTSAVHDLEVGDKVGLQRALRQLVSLRGNRRPQR